MSTRMAVDFGTSNTIIAYWDDARGSGVPLHIAEYSSFMDNGGDDGRVAVIPSVIHFAAREDLRWIGNQVIDRNLLQSPQTFRAMKRHIANRSPVKIRCHGRAISHFEAGTAFLSDVLTVAREQLSLKNEEVIFTVPVEAFEHFEDWIGGVAESCGIRRLRLIDEPSAAALGYGANSKPGDVLLIFDFGGGTLDVAVVLIEETAGGLSGRRCRVLGKAGLDIGGLTIDQWIFQEVLRRNNLSDADENIRRISNLILLECRAIKEKLSFHEHAGLSLVDPDSGRLLEAAFDRAGFEALLEENEALRKIDATIRRALNAARDRGYDEERIQSVLMVGGSSFIPAVRKTLQRIFGRERVRMERPIDAVACGAAAFAAGVDFFDHVQHEYAIRYIDNVSGRYKYRTLVKKGSDYPDR